MAKTSDLQALVEQFATSLEAIVTRRANEAFAAKFDVVKSQILGGAAPAAAAAPAKVKGRVGRPPGSRASYAAAAKPCPVCGTPNKGRRFSYLCDKHRSDENRAKFKGASKNAAPAAAPAPAKRGPGRPPKAVKRGPGRPPKVEKMPEPAKA